MKNTLTLIGAIAVAIAVIAAAAIIVKKYTDNQKKKKAAKHGCECYPYGDIDGFDMDDCDCDECSWDEVPVEEDDDEFGFEDIIAKAEAEVAAEDAAKADDSDIPF